MTHPIRIQRRRTPSWTMPANTVYVGRPGPWSNPFRVFPNGPWTQQEAVEKFRKYLWESEQGRVLTERARTELRGKNLMCWCPLSEPCHADVLLEIANSDIDQAAAPRSEAEEFSIICIQRFIAEWKATPEHLKGQFLTAITTIGIELMHGTLGKEFTQGYLDKARASLNVQDKAVFRPEKGH